MIQCNRLAAISFTFLLLICTFSSANAQKFYLGAQVGGGLPALENFDFNNSDELDGLGYHGGVMASIRFNRVAAQGELLYSYNEFEGDVLGISTTFQYHRVALPVLFKFYFAGGAHFLLGPKVGFLISANQEDEEGFSFDIANTTESLDVSLLGGVGYDLPFGLTANVRYNVGLTDFPGPDQNLSGLQLSIGYTFLETGGIAAGIPSVKKRKWKGK